MGQSQHRIFTMRMIPGCLRFVTDVNNNTMLSLLILHVNSASAFAFSTINWTIIIIFAILHRVTNYDMSYVMTKEEEVRGERMKSGAEIMTSQDGCRCEL